MKKTTIKIGGLIIALILTATTAQSQELIPDPDELINDYISLGEFNEAGNTEGWGQNSINLLSSAEVSRHNFPSGCNIR